MSGCTCSPRTSRGPTRPTASTKASGTSPRTCGMRLLRSRPVSAVTGVLSSTGPRRRACRRRTARSTGTEDIQVIVRFAGDAWTTGDQTLAAKFRAAASVLAVLPQQRMDAVPVDSGGSTIVIKSVDAPSLGPIPANGTATWLRAVLHLGNGAAGNDVNFYKSADGSHNNFGAVGPRIGDAGTLPSTTSGRGHPRPGSRAAAKPAHGRRRRSKTSRRSGR